MIAPWFVYASVGGLSISLAADDITPDGTTQTAIDRAQNGVRTVNIAPPTQGGVSHNKYTGFNVEQTGAIMNNSLQVGVSQLGGALSANPHYTDRTAEIILNEVTSTRRSELKGYTEIFGDEAEFILANPNGITCSGCGFINTSRLGLVTGTPRLDIEGRLDELAIGQGDVLVDEQGMNAENIRYVDIVTRAAKIQGELIAGEELNIHTGNDRFDYKTRTVLSSSDSPATEGTAFAVDASALGGMYAGKIQIISTEAGFGVRNDATLVANVDDLVITAEGDIAYTNALAERNIALQARDNITQTGISQAGNDLRLTAGEQIELSGDSVDGQGVARSVGDMKIAAGSTLDNAGHRLSVGGDLSLAAAAVDNSGGGEMEIGGNLTTVGQIVSLDNRGGAIKGLNAETELALNVRDALYNDGGSIVSTGSVSLVIDADHDLHGTLSAGENLEVQAHGLRNLTHLDAGGMIRLTATGDFRNEDSAVLASDLDIEVTADQVVTNYAEITSGRNLRLEAKGGDLTNEATGKVTGGLGTTALIASSSVINRNKLSSAQDLTIAAAGLDNLGQIATGQDLTATVSGNLYNRENTLLFAGRELTLNVGGALDNDRAEIYSQGDMTLQGPNGGNSGSIRNYVGTIEAGGNLTIRTDRLDNLAEVYDSDSGGYYGYNVSRVNKGGHGWNYYAIMEQDEATSTLRANPAYVSAGGNLGIYNATINNYSSVISAHGNLTVSGGSLNNETASEDTVDLDRKWGKAWEESKEDCDWKGSCHTDRWTEYDEYWDTYTTTVYAQEQAIFNAHGTVSANVRHLRNGSVKNLDNPSHTTPYNTASLEQIQQTGQVDLTEFLDLPQGEHGLFVLNRPDTEHRYLIESNVEFIDTTQFVGSSYFLERMGVDLDEELRLMGDAVVETRLVERAILDVTQHTFLSKDIGNAADQMRQLYDNAIAEAERFEQEGMPLTVGIALSPEQVRTLRHDILWLEERGMAGARVLAPQLYLSQTTLAQIETGTGPVISGGDIFLASEQDLGNQGTITARQDIGLSSEGSFTNIGSVDAGESLVADVKEDILNRGSGSLYGGDLVALYAGGDIRNESTSEEIHLGADIVSRFADTATIGSGGDMILDASGDIVQKAAKLDATGSALLKAGGDIRFETIALRNKSDNRVSSDNYSIHDRTEHIGSEATFGGDLVMESGGDTTLTASRLEVGGGAELRTGGNFNLLSAQNTYHSESHYEYDTGGWFGSSGSEDSVSDETRQVSSVLKVGEGLSIASGWNVNIVASKVDAEGDTSVSAAGSLNLLSQADTFSASSSSTHDGLFSQSEEQHSKQTIDHVSAELHVGGRLDVDAKQVTLVASEIKAREAEITTDLLQLVSEQTLDSESHFSDGSGILLRKIKNKGYVEKGVAEASIQVQEQLVVNGQALMEEGLQKNNLLKSLTSQSDLDAESIELIKQMASSEEWDDEMTTLSATGQLLVQVVVGYFTAGAGAAITGTTTAVAAGTTTATQAAVNAAITSLVQQATTQMVESALTGELKFDAGAMLKGAIVGAASGFTSHQLSSMDAFQSDNFFADIQKTALESTSSAVVETAVYGGNFADRWGTNLRAGVVDLAGSKLTGKIGDMGEALGGDGSIGKTLFHAGVGCATAAGKGGDCASGALGSAVAEQLSNTLGSNGLAEKEDKLILDLATIGSATVTGLDGKAAVDSAVMTDTYNRRLHQDETKVLEKELAELEKQNLTEQELAKAQTDLMASACVLVNCADGVSKDDPNYTQLRDLQDYGESLKGSSTYDQVAKYQAEGLFEYGRLDTVNDFLTRNGEVVTRVTGAVDIASGSSAVVTGAGLCTTGIGCVGTAVLIPLGGKQVIEGANKLLGGYQYTEGKEVLNSFSSDTHSGNYNPALELGLNYGLDIALASSGKIIDEGVYLLRKSKLVKGQTEVVQRWMSKAELGNTRKTGLLRGGKKGAHYVTDAANKNPLRARQRLALPQTPEVRVTLKAPKGVFSQPSRIKPDFHMPGGGMERKAIRKIPIKIIKEGK